MFNAIKFYANRVHDFRHDPFFPTSLPRALYLALFNADDYFTALPAGGYVVTIASVTKTGRADTMNTLILDFNPDAANALGRAVNELKPHLQGGR